ncbi:MAG: hypothetical protein KatS3mg082_1424 [Nitrospiraceae bacterium]|nr:MAG: hypothetical protein KatS3mg082_1424 [Nitrospiraceae bacterium]
MTEPVLRARYAPAAMNPAKKRAWRNAGRRFFRAVVKRLQELGYEAHTYYSEGGIAVSGDHYFRAFVPNAEIGVEVSVNIDGLWPGCRAGDVTGFYCECRRSMDYLKLPPNSKKRLVHQFLGESSGPNIPIAPTNTQLFDEDGVCTVDRMVAALLTVLPALTPADTPSISVPE